MCPVCLNYTHDIYCPKQPGAFPILADDWKIIKHEDKENN